MGITVLLDDPFYGTLPLTALVPSKFPVALNGRPYAIDTKLAGSEAWLRRSVPLLRDQADTSERPGEQSLSRDGTWRRAVESWHSGAGQTNFDRPESSASRFRSSKGVDVWERWELSLLNDTESIRSSAATNLLLTVVGNYLYVADGTECYHASDLDAVAWTAADIQDGESAASVLSTTSDGYYLYAALGVNGIHRTQAGTATSDHFSDLQASLVGYVKDRLMAAGNGADKHKLYNVIASGAAPAELFTHPNTDWTWVGFAEGSNQIYAAGYSGDKSVIYRTAVKADGTALDTPVVAGRLPEGEILRSIDDYLGSFILLGTDKGFRVALPNTNGDLTIGARVDTGSGVRCFEGQDSFVWYGLTNYDGTSTGLGRMNLAVDTAGGEVPVPAYASDLMATGQGNVLSVTTFDNRRVFTVSGLGVYAEDTTNKVASGTLDSGLITYGLPDPKVALFADVRHDSLVGSVAVSIAGDDSDSFSHLGTNTDDGSTGFSVSAGERSAVRHELRLTLTGSGSRSPAVTRVTFRSRPAATRGRTFLVPLLLAETVTVKGGEHRFDPLEELEAIEELVESASPVYWQEGTRSFSVIVEDFDWRPTHLTTNGEFWNGTCVVKLALNPE